MNGRLGDEDRKNVIISEEGKMKKDVIQKYTPRFDYPARVDIPSIEAKKNEKCRVSCFQECISMKRGRNACEKIRETRLGKDGRKKIGSKQTRNKISNKIVTSVI